MRHSRFTLDDSTVIVEWGIAPSNGLTIVERKGWGHPDTLADHLAERLRGSTADTRWRTSVPSCTTISTSWRCWGARATSATAQVVLSPVRVLVNGRAARVCAGEIIPVKELIVETVEAFFRERLPELDEHLRIELNVSSNPSPGAVQTGEGIPDRSVWFAPRNLDDLRERRTLVANDTSLGTGWAPENRVEVFVRELVDHLSAPGHFLDAHPWCGSDVKVMAHATDEELDVVLCVPQKSSHVSSRVAYLANTEVVLAECQRLAGRLLPDLAARFLLNARDIPERDELYLTYTGSSIESGDEGVVGRGNRVNGLITPLSPMNLEGANGKNRSTGISSAPIHRPGSPRLVQESRRGPLTAGPPACRRVARRRPNAA